MFCKSVGISIWFITTGTDYLCILMSPLRKLFKWIGYTLALLLLLIILFCGYVWKVSDIKPPKIADTSACSLQKKHVDGSLYTIGDNWIRKNKYGLYELYISGKPFELGVKSGMLSQPLIICQEDAYAQEIKQLVPSERYRRFLRYEIAFKNRNVPEHITDEYKQELYGISFSASDSLSWIGDRYSRMLNWQSHGIGNGVQNQLPGGNSSFGAWGKKTNDGSLLLGQNFSSWAGEKYEENMIVAFYKPDEGHRFASITWGGFAGAVSGMNDRGLTVTINAAGTSTSCGGTTTPASLLAREILQYAGNIKEAIAIAHNRKISVSAIFLIGSVADHKAAIIEKTPDAVTVYDPGADYVQCTDHFQSKLLHDQKSNKEQMAESASVYRYRRLQELLNNNYPLTPARAAAVLCDRRGLHGADIGDGNEKAVNKLMGQHSVIFQPDSLRFWVNTQPWQASAYICYDLKKVSVLNGLQQDIEIADTALNIAPDTFFYSNEYKKFQIFRKNKIALLQNEPVDTAQVTHSNPNFYDAYRIAGDYCKEKKWYPAAINYYVTALSRQVATLPERKLLQEKIVVCEKEYNAQSK